MKVKTLNTKLLASSWKLKLFEDTLELRPGKIQPTLRLSLPDFVVVIAVRKSDGKIPLVNQYRHGSGIKMWELPAGHVEPRERLIDCAKREFREETGFELLEPKCVSSIYTMPPRSKQRAHIFIGHVGRRMNQHLDETEYLVAKLVTVRTAQRLLMKTTSSTHLLAFFLAREEGLF